MEKPQYFLDKIKYYIWRYIISPVFPYVRNIFLRLHVLYHNERQPYHVGFLAPEKSVEDFKKFLIDQKGFFNNKIAWVDTDEVLSVRLFDGYDYQYHVRLFKDREIRAHYEKTPEIHPFKHFFRKTFEPKTEHVKEILGEWCV